MNQFFIQGVINYFEPPKGQQKSGILLLKTGYEKKITNNPLQIVNSSMIRIPSRLESFFPLLKQSCTIELRGRFQGIVKRTAMGHEIFDTELMAEGLYKTDYVDSSFVEVGQRDHSMVNFFIKTGKVKHYQPPDKDNPKNPGRLFLLTGPLRHDGKRSYEYVNMVVISIFSKTVQKKAEVLKEGAAVEVRGHTVGLLKTIPGTNDSSLSATLIGDYIKPISIAISNIGLSTSLPQSDKIKT